METKTFTAELKMDGADQGIDLEDGEFLAIISDPTLDRDGEIIDAGAFLPLPDKITVDIDHGMSVRHTVGSGKPFYAGEKLMLRARFASTEAAQEVRTLVTEGHIDKMSVAFSGAERRDVDGVPHITKGELLNVAVVAIPANPSAQILAAKSADLEQEDGPIVTVVLERPDTVADDAAGDWSAAVAEFSRSWTPDNEISTGDAPEGAPEGEAADKAAELQAATRQRRAQVELAKARMALAD